MKCNYIFMLLLIVLGGMTGLACEGPAGGEGLQGPEGPIGPAGDDGSMIYAGEGEPGVDLGDIGDYYLNQNTGELYGPKETGGWGEPGIVLMGEDGADGQDGEDGSQIHAGSGVPDNSLGVEGDYYLDKDSYELYGPKTSSGWGSPLNLKGADGNANVTRYMFPGHDFTSAADTTLTITDVEDEAEMVQSSWNVYLVDGSFYDHIPGTDYYGGTYGVYHGWETVGEMIINIRLEEGTGHNYERIEVVRIEAGNTEDYTDMEQSIIPIHLDVSDYNAVAEYYGFGG